MRRRRRSITPATVPATASPGQGALLSLLVVAPFALLFLLHAGEPSALVFDETHYVPASDALARFADDLNWERPPLSKWILGIGARVLTGLHLAAAPAAHRLV